jgi:hypothetical protein
MRLDDQTITLGIQNLIFDNRFADSVEMIAEIIDNLEITSESWENLFNSQEITKILIDPVSSEAIARLLTLKAIILPESLPELLNWLNLYPNQQFKNSSFEFQQKFYDQYQKVATQKRSGLSSRLYQGVNQLLIGVFQNQINRKMVVTLLNNNQSIWQIGLKPLVRNFEKDLEYIANNFEQIAEIIKNNLARNHQNHQDQYLKEFLYSDYHFWLPLIKEDSDLSCYLPFAKLFELLKVDRLAAYFYQLSQGKVPHQVFLSAFGKRPYELYLGLLVKRDIPWVEKLQNTHLILNTISVCLTGAGLLLLLATLKSFNATEVQSSGILAQKGQHNLAFSKNKTQLNNQELPDKANLKESQNSNNQLTALAPETAKNSDLFYPNREAIKKVVYDLIPEISQEYNLPQKSGAHNAYYEIIATLKTTLDITGPMSYSGVIEGEWKITTETLEQQQQKWFGKIRVYQKSIPNFYGKYGVIDRVTLNQLKHDIREQIKQKYQ